MNHLIGKNGLLDQNLILKKAQIGESDKIADLGCGMHGYFVFPASLIVGKHGIVYAVDILKIALNNIQRGANQESLANIKTIWSDLEVFKGTELPNGSLNAILIINTLHQSQKRIQILREASRMLKKDGHLTIVEWGNNASPLGPNKKNKVIKKALIDVLIKLGHKLEDDYEAGNYHYGLVFRKM